MNKDELLERLAQIEQDMRQNRAVAQQYSAMLEQANANYNALLGAQQELTQWLSKVKNDAGQQASSDEFNADIA